MGVERGHMIRLGAHGENPAGDPRMNSLHAAIEHFRKSGDISDFSEALDAGLFQGFMGSAGG